MAYALNRTDIIAAHGGYATPLYELIPPQLLDTIGSQSLLGSLPLYVLGSQNTKAGSWNVADYTPPVVDNLMVAGQATNDPAQRLAIYSQLLQRLQTDLPYIGLYSTEYSVAMSSKFTEPGFSCWPTTAVSGYPGLYLSLKSAA